jgi:hypothetical protein
VLCKVPEWHRDNTAKIDKIKMHSGHMDLKAIHVQQQKKNRKRTTVLTPPVLVTWCGCFY